MAEKTKPNRKKRSLGRPKSPAGKTRPNRIVTFVTDREYAKIEQIVIDSDKSMSAVCHELLVRSLSSSIGEDL